MTDQKDIKDPQQDNPQKPESNPDPSKTEDKSTETHINTDDLPEKFKGKSAQEIAKSYLELEKKLGSSSKDLSELAEWRKLGEVIKSDPEIVGLLKKKAGAKPESKQEDTKTDSDVRDAVANQIVIDFEKEKGINFLEPEKRAEIHQRIGSELADMLDPSGSKSVAQVLSEIPVKRLAGYLDKAYRLAIEGDEQEKARLRGMAEARKNAEATFSSFSSTSVASDKVSLTEDEKATAKKLGIKEEDYLKQKKELFKK